MDAFSPPSRIQADFSALAAELDSLRDLLVTLSLQLTDIQFEADTELRAGAKWQTDQLLKACQVQSGTR